MVRRAQARQVQRDIGQPRSLVAALAVFFVPPWFRRDEAPPIY